MMMMMMKPSVAHHWHGFLRGKRSHLCLRWKGLMVTCRTVANTIDISVAAAYTVLGEKLKLSSFLFNRCQSCGTQSSFRQEQSFQWKFSTNGIKILKPFVKELELQMEHHGFASTILKTEHSRSTGDQRWKQCRRSKRTGQEWMSWQQFFGLLRHCAFGFCEGPENDNLCLLEESLEI